MTRVRVALFEHSRCCPAPDNWATIIGPVGDLEKLVSLPIADSLGVNVNSERE
jgi:hypothetical protein